MYSPQACVQQPGGLNLAGYLMNCCFVLRWTRYASMRTFRPCIRNTELSLSRFRRELKTLYFPKAYPQRRHLGASGGLRPPKDCKIKILHKTEIWPTAVDRSTVNRWRTVVSATWKYDDTRLNMSHEGAARVWHVQPRVVIFPCRTNYRVSYVLSSDQLQVSWIICKLKSFSPLYLHDLNTQDRWVIFGVSKTLCDFGHKQFFYRRIN